MQNASRIIAQLATLLIAVVFAIILGKDVGEGNTRFGALSQLVSTVGDIPKIVKSLAAPHPEYVLPKEAFSEPVYQLNHDIYAVHTFGPTNEAALVNLRNREIIKSWAFENHKPFPNARYFAQMLPDSSLFIYVHEGDWMARLKPNGSIMWEKSGELVYHHSAEFTTHESVWICARDHGYLHNYGTTMLDTLYLNSQNAYPMMDEVLLEVDLQTGATLDSLSLLEFFLTNDLNPVYKSFYGPAYGDALHLNDIEPINFTDSVNNYLPGDLLVSNRTQNEILHIRPNTKTLLHTFSTGLYSQHDVDIVGDTLITCFNNNAPSLFDGRVHGDFSKTPHLGIHSKVGSFRLDGTPAPHPLNTAFAAQQLYSETEGLIQNLGNGWTAVEEQNAFTLYIFHGDTLKFKDGLNYFGDSEYYEIPNWTHFYLNN